MVAALSLRAAGGAFPARSLRLGSEAHYLR
jgi:hypothetical protein